MQVLGLAADKVLNTRTEHDCGTATRLPLDLQQHLGREPQQGVAGEDRAVRAEDRPRGGPVPPLGVAVHEIVVQQGEVVDQLHGDRAGEPGLDRGTGSLG